MSTSPLERQFRPRRTIMIQRCATTVKSRINTLYCFNEVRAMAFNHRLGVFVPMIDTWGLFATPKANLWESNIQLETRILLSLRVQSQSTRSKMWFHIFCGLQNEMTVFERLRSNPRSGESSWEPLRACGLITGIKFSNASNEHVHVEVLTIDRALGPMLRPRPPI